MVRILLGSNRAFFNRFSPSTNLSQALPHPLAIYRRTGGWETSSESTRVSSSGPIEQKFGTLLPSCRHLSISMLEKMKNQDQQRHRQRSSQLFDPSARGSQSSAQKTRRDPKRCWKSKRELAMGQKDATQTGTIGFGLFFLLPIVFFLVPFFDPLPVEGLLVCCPNLIGAHFGWTGCC